MLRPFRFSKPWKTFYRIFQPLESGCAANRRFAVQGLRFSQYLEKSDRKFPVFGKS